MRIINKPNLKKMYIEKHKINECFSIDVEKISDLVLFDEDENIIMEGIISDYLYFLVNGECRFFTVSDNGSIISLGGAKNYGVFGEAGSFFEMRPLNYVQAVSNSYCLRISLVKYRELLFEDLKFLQFLCRILASRIRKNGNDFPAFVSASAEKRLAAYLLEINDEGRINNTLKTISEYICISYRQLLRVINSFIQRGYLKKENGHYYINDKESLKILADNMYSYFDRYNL